MSVKNAVVTGASRGIGKAIVKEFVQNGINVWACASKKNETFERDLQELEKKYQVWIRPVYFDLKNEEEIKNSLRKIIQEKKSIDILVNNAGMPYNGLMQMTPLSKLREVLEVNYVSQIAVTQIISKAMIRQKTGNIINIGSIGGIEARKGYLAYGSSKTALLWATRSISKELAEYNIRVNAVAPGLIDTDMGGFKPKEETEKIIRENSMKRLGAPEEIAKVVYFLASDSSSFVTGSIINADGGRLQ